MGECGGEECAYSTYMEPVRVHLIVVFSYFSYLAMSFIIASQPPAF